MMKVSLNDAPPGSAPMHWILMRWLDRVGKFPFATLWKYGNDAKNESDKCP